MADVLVDMTRRWSWRELRLFGFLLPLLREVEILDQACHGAADHIDDYLGAFADRPHDSFFDVRFDLPLIEGFFSL